MYTVYMAWRNDLQPRTPIHILVKHGNIYPLIVYVYTWTWIYTVKFCKTILWTLNVHSLYEHFLWQPLPLSTKRKRTTDNLPMKLQDMHVSFYCCFTHLHLFCCLHHLKLDFLCIFCQLFLPERFLTLNEYLTAFYHLPKSETLNVWKKEQRKVQK